MTPEQNRLQIQLALLQHHLDDARIYNGLGYDDASQLSLDDAEESLERVGESELTEQAREPVEEVAESGEEEAEELGIPPSQHEVDKSKKLAFQLGMDVLCGQVGIRGVRRELFRKVAAQHALGRIQDHEIGLAVQGFGDLPHTKIARIPGSQPGNTPATTGGQRTITLTPAQRSGGSSVAQNPYRADNTPRVHGPGYAPQTPFGQYQRAAGGYQMRATPGSQGSVWNRARGWAGQQQANLQPAAQRAWGAAQRGAQQAWRATSGAYGAVTGAYDRLQPQGFAPAQAAAPAPAAPLTRVGSRLEARGFVPRSAPAAAAPRAPLPSVSAAPVAGSTPFGFESQTGQTVARAATPEASAAAQAAPKTWAQRNLPNLPKAMSAARFGLNRVLPGAMIASHGADMVGNLRSGNWEEGALDALKGGANFFGPWAGAAMTAGIEGFRPMGEALGDTYVQNSSIGEMNRRNQQAATPEEIQATRDRVNARRLAAGKAPSKPPEPSESAQPPAVVDPDAERRRQMAEGRQAMEASRAQAAQASEARRAQEAAGTQPT